MSSDFVLYEGPLGYALFETKQSADVVGNRLKEVQAAAQDLAKFGKMVQLKSFLPFEYDCAGIKAKINTDCPAQIWKASFGRTTRCFRRNCL